MNSFVPSAILLEVEILGLTSGPAEFARTIERPEVNGGNRTSHDSFGTHNAAFANFNPLKDCYICAYACPAES
jgi:hypothetical protein